MDNILTLFTSEDKNEIRKAIKQIIIKQVEKDFEDNCHYLINPNEIEDMISEVIEEVKDEVKYIYREKLIKGIEEKLKI